MSADIENVQYVKRVSYRIMKIDNRRRDTYFVAMKETWNLHTLDGGTNVCEYKIRNFIGNTKVFYSWRAAHRVAEKLTRDILYNSRPIRHTEVYKSYLRYEDFLKEIGGNA